MSEADIRRHTSTELKAMRERGEDQTDLDRVRAMTDDELERLIANDPDEGMETDDRGEVAPEKALVCVDGDVVAFFRAQGPDWQARINDALRATFKP